MKHQPWRKYYRDLFKDFTQAYKRSLADQKKKDIHQMRVCIKKMRAFWRLISIATNGLQINKKVKKSVRKLFKAAGSYRETQLNIELLEKFGANRCKKVIKAQKMMLRHSKEVLTGEIHDFQLSKFQESNNVFEEQLEEVTLLQVNEGIDRIIYEVKTKIRTLVLTLPNNENLHEIRSQLRTMREMLDIRKGIGTNSKKEKRKGIKKLYERLGDWHDIDILLESLKVSDHLMNNKCDSALKNLQKKQTKSVKKLKHEISEYF